MLAKGFVEVHSFNNLSEEVQRGRKATDEYKNLVEQEVDSNDVMNIPFTKAELNPVKKSKMTAPGKDQICYIMISHLSETSKNVLLELYNRVWEEGKWWYLYQVIIGLSP